MPPVLLRFAGLDPLMPDSQPFPPDRQLRQPARRRRHKRRAVVAADRPRHPALAKGRFQHRPRPLLVDTRHRRQPHQIAAGGVGHRQRFASLAVARLKPALVVDRPDVVRLLGMRQRFGGRRNPARPFPFPVHQPFAPQQLPNRTQRRRPGLGFPQFPPQLLRPPTGMLPALFQQLFPDSFVPGMGPVLRCMTPVGHRLDAPRFVPLQPLVSRLAGNPIAPVRLRHRHLPALHLQHELRSFFHSTALFPGHSCPLSAVRLPPPKVSTIRPDFLSTIIPDRAPSLANTLMSGPNSAKITAAVSALIPGIVCSSSYCSL